MTRHLAGTLLPWLACSAAVAATSVPPALAAAPGTAAAAAEERVDRADIDRTTITGHKELPKVLHIVPWKQPLPGHVTSRARTSVLDEALAPVDRDVFRRQLRYRAQIESTPAPQEKTP
jgi:hypothetical protein